MIPRPRETMFEYLRVSPLLRFPIVFSRAELSSWPSTYLQRVFDEKSKRGFLVLSVQKNEKAIDETEGILSMLVKQNLETADLVKKVWKASE